MKSAASFIELARTSYIQRLVSIIATFQKPGVRLIIEPLLRDSKGAPLLEGTLDLPMRIDFWVENKGSFRSESSPRLLSSGINFSKGTLKNHLSSFLWDACEVTASGQFASLTSLQLQKWFVAEIDPDEKRPADAVGLHGVVHFLSDPILKDEKLGFQVDFGSADVTALDRLFDVLRECGAREVTLS